ncbi:MAG TPA: hypothetical protein VEH27_10995 [Methylomirabilota bacterium]|nr:hypothetical protein [Methylomirabilota bacterium]
MDVLCLAETLNQAFPHDPRTLYKLRIVALTWGQKDGAREVIGKASEGGGNPTNLEALNDRKAEGLWSCDKEARPFHPEDVSEVSSRLVPGRA